MTSRASSCRSAWLAGLFLCLSAASLTAGYKARPWTVRTAETYPARLTSEAITIGVEPLSSDTLAAAIFDKSDIVTRGIMPLVVVIFNENDFPITVESASIEVISGDAHIHTLLPQEAVHQVFAKRGKSFIPQPIPRISTDKLDADALEDFGHKFLGSKTVEPHAKAGGFLYLRLPPASDVGGWLAAARVYIPEIYRQDTGTKMIFFEMDLKPAIPTSPSK